MGSDMQLSIWVVAKSGMLHFVCGRIGLRQVEQTEGLAC